MGRSSQNLLCSTPHIPHLHAERVRADAGLDRRQQRGNHLVISLYQPRGLLHLSERQQGTASKQALGGRGARHGHQDEQERGASSASRLAPPVPKAPGQEARKRWVKVQGLAVRMSKGGKHHPPRSLFLFSLKAPAEQGAGSITRLAAYSAFL
eukprot:350649-Chlamydomonas_euryale.AAC.1